MRTDSSNRSRQRYEANRIGAIVLNRNINAETRENQTGSVRGNKSPNEATVAEERRRGGNGEGYEAVGGSGSGGGRAVGDVRKRRRMRGWNGEESDEGVECGDGAGGDGAVVHMLFVPGGEGFGGGGGGKRGGEDTAGAAERVPGAGEANGERSAKDLEG